MKIMRYDINNRNFNFNEHNRNNIIVDALFELVSCEEIPFDNNRKYFIWMIHFNHK